MAEIETGGRSPGFHFHLEVGVSWNPRSGGKGRQLNYTSKSLRRRDEDAQQTSGRRTIAQADGPLALTTYGGQHSQSNWTSTRPQPSQIVWDPTGYQYYDRQPSQHQHFTYHNTSRSHTQTQPSSFAQASLAMSASQRDVQQARTSSRNSPASCRGKTAQAPFNDSAWYEDPEPLGATALPQRSTTLPATRKALPPLPTLAMDDRARGRATEISSLATALLTVDNGFEDQWWYQGTRLVNIAGELVSPAVLRGIEARGGSIGWALADGDRVGNVRSNPPPPRRRNSTSSLPSETARAHSNTSSVVDIVSPLSDFPSPVPSHKLRRSATSRSDELHM